MHLPILPILWPMIFGLILLLPMKVERNLARYWIAKIGVIGFLVIAIQSLMTTYQEGTLVYYLGNWPAGIAISLKMDELSAGFLVLFAILALACQQSFLPLPGLREKGITGLFGFAKPYQTDEEVTELKGHEDAWSPYLYSLYFFQLMGIAGAFLTSDIFNLFVFFEILLISSYALLVSGTQRERIQSVMHYVLINLMGSAFFLIGLALVYASMGTLDMTSLVAAYQAAELSDNPLGITGLSILLLVFMLKAGVFPLHFWLVRTYSNAYPVLAALFAIMTKIGLYSILRVHGSILLPNTEAEGVLVSVPALEWTLLLSGLASITIACFGMLASPSLRALIAYSVIASMGALMIVISTMQASMLPAVLYYTLHTTLVTAALFLLSAVIVQQRGQAQDRIVRSRALPQHTILMLLYFIMALAVIGLPPLSGFLAKFYLLRSVMGSDSMIAIWFAILFSSLISLVAFSRAGSTLFLRHAGVENRRDQDTHMTLGQRSGLSVLVISLVSLMIFAAPAMNWSERASQRVIAIASCDAGASCQAEVSNNAR